MSTPIRKYRPNGGEHVAIVSSCLPRKCGIAKFSFDLGNALTQLENISSVAYVAVNNSVNYDYPDRVICEIDQENLEDYIRAAMVLNSSDIEVVSLQHEFGLFGGPDGKYLRVFLKHIRKPVITTLHTLSQYPSPGQREVIKDIFDFSRAVVVMNSLATDLLADIYDVPLTKVKVIPHGVNLKEYEDSSHYKQQLDLEDHLLVLTFGFLSPNKGIETMINALPYVASECPDVLYVVLGMTHPIEKKHKGEIYREQLKGIAEELMVSDHVLFVDKFVDDEIMDMFIGAADMVVCPYHSQEQITSGVLSAALSRGRAVISTPYLHAREVLSEGRGLLVEPKDPEAMAQAVIRLAKNEQERNFYGERVHAYSRQLGWDIVAEKYSNTFSSVCNQREAVRSRVNAFV